MFSGAPLDLVFIDGMHLFEYALRDFMNVEANSHAGTVVAVHDCVPYLEVTTARERTTDAWTGDIWKLVVCLKEHRPDLDVLIVDSPPTGLCLISGLDRASSVLADSYDQLLEHYVPQPWSTYADDFADAFQAWSVPVGEALDRVSHLRREGWASTVLRLQSLSEAQASAEVRLRDERAAWEARLAAAQRENDALRDANGALRDEVAEHLAQLAAIEASESWRLTAPVRAVADAARRLTADARRRRERGRSA